ncbi:MAG: hypothetical protein CVU33_12330 [Betaproteobacteria bacterium HGW-Betaproteobacteria-6]|jgi:hypothetical protein|nr:MAG: hypothetical protein CVU33_12330 [Betaproteobacteria bacterium HGW-Betaproteobacteria-6]
MLASHLHSLNRLAGREHNLQGLCQAGPECPALLLTGRMAAFRAFRGEQGGGRAACSNSHHLLQSCTPGLFKLCDSPLPYGAFARQISD